MHRMVDGLFPEDEIVRVMELTEAELKNARATLNSGEVSGHLHGNPQNSDRRMTENSTGNV